MKEEEAGEKASPGAVPPIRQSRLTRGDYYHSLKCSLSPGNFVTENSVLWFGTGHYN